MVVGITILDSDPTRMGRGHACRRDGAGITVERAVPSVYVRRPVFAPTPRGMALWKLGLVPLDSVGGHQQEHMRIGRLDETLKLGVNDTSYG